MFDFDLRNEQISRSFESHELSEARVKITMI
jgi:hypothetical protein